MNDTTVPRSFTGLLRAMIFCPIILSCMAAADLVLRLLLLVRPQREAWPFVAGTTRVVAWLLDAGLNIRIRVDERLESLMSATGGTIVVANHHSPLDILLMSYAFHARPVRFICRPGLERGIPFISLWIRLGCVVLRRRARDNESQLLSLGRRIADDGSVAVIFPEGQKRLLDYACLMPFKSRGLEKLTEGAPGAQVVAIAIRGANAVCPGPWRLLQANRDLEIHVAGHFAPADAAQTPLAQRCEMAIRRTLDLSPDREDCEALLWTSSPTH